VIRSSVFDILGHVIESFVSTRFDAVAAFLAPAVLSTVREVVARYAAEPIQIEVQEALDLQIAGMFGGIAQDRRSVGVAHSIAHALGSDLPHGLAVGLVLPSVIRANAAGDEAAAAHYARLAAEVGIGSSASDIAGWVHDFASADEIARLVSSLERLDREAVVESAECDITAATNPVTADAALIEWILADVVQNGSE
jgi:alcohol dehydrogenase class IV